MTNLNAIDERSKCCESLSKRKREVSKEQAEDIRRPAAVTPNRRRQIALPIGCFGGWRPFVTLGKRECDLTPQAKGGDRDGVITDAITGPIDGSEDMQQLSADRGVPSERNPSEVVGQIFDGTMTSSRHEEGFDLLVG